MNKQIFISSTYKDLIPHREIIWDMLLSLDLNISGMEKFGARPEKPLETCLKEVEESDIFIGIIGMRYGSVDTKTGKSFTQLEYEKAVDLGLEVLVYMIDEKNALIRADSIDPENHIKLKDFKSTLSNSHTIDHFISEKDLVSKLKTKLVDSHKRAENIKKNRPEKIEGKIENIKINGEPWVVILGSRNNKPYEVYTGKAEESFSILSHINEGWVIKSSTTDGRIRYDFQYEDSHGYKTTIEGISSRNSRMTVLVSKLLEKNIPIITTIEILDEIDFNEGELEKETKNAVIKILKKQYGLD